MTNDDQLETAVEAIADVLDTLEVATGFSSFQVVVEGKLPADAQITLDADDIRSIVGALHNAHVGISFARGVRFKTVATGRYGDPASFMPVSVLDEAEGILRQASKDNDDDDQRP
jgi:hypothetical protein